MLLSLVTMTTLGHARALEPRPERPALRRRVYARTLHEIGAVDSARPDLQFHVERTMANRRRDLAPHEVPVCVDYNRSHFHFMLQGSLLE